MKNEFGGYFELELRKNKEFHTYGCRLNTGRNCLEYILKTKKYKKVYLPYYMCDVLFEPFLKTKIKFNFYHLDENLDPIIDTQISENEAILYINYFGVKENTVNKLNKQCKNLIIDNSQAFFSKPLINVDTFYSARKFFGVSDGAYLYTNKTLLEEIKTDTSYNRISHLIIRSDINAEKGYKYFLENEKKLNGQPIKFMSKLTKSILSSINYKKVYTSRMENFYFIHNELKKINQLNINVENVKGPMAYPFLYKKDIKNKLINRKIFVPTYWKDVEKRVKKNHFEYKLSKFLVPLPIDQRIKKEDIKYILSILYNSI